MTETRCRYDSETGAYLTLDGEECDTPKRDHCTARKTCPQHLGWGELTCARCLGRTRQDIKQVAERAPLLMTAALESRRIESEAGVLAGPAVDPRGWVEYRLAATRHLEHWLTLGRINERQYVFARGLMDDDEFHPFTVLTRWHMMLAEDYGHDLPARMTLTDSAGYLDRQLSRVANDEEQDFRLMAREIRTCRAHMDTALSVGRFREKGAPCPECVAAKKDRPEKLRLVREYGHWCEDPKCERIHLADESEDRWVCPRDREHWWDVESYRKWVEERKGA